MLKILGDINFTDGYFYTGFGIGTAIKNGQDPFRYLDRKQSDFWIGNFECVCAEIEDTNHPFVISPEYLGRIKHLDLYGIANNHIMQAGEEPFIQTCRFLEREGVKYAGSDEIRSITFEHQGKKVGFLAFSQRPDNFTDTPCYWHLPEYSEIKSELEKLNGCDYVIAFLHWGYEFINYPNIDQKLLAHWLVDNGVDLVVGMHPHVSQGMEVYNGKHIFYSLGNSLFNMNWEPTQYGILVSVDLGGEEIKVATDYIELDSDGFPHKLKEVPDDFSLNNLNELLKISEENEKYFRHAREREKLYQTTNRKGIIKDFLSGKNPNVLSLISDFIKRRLLCK